MINDREVLLDELVTVTVKKLTFSRKICTLAYVLLKPATLTFFSESLL